MGVEAGTAPLTLVNVIVPVQDAAVPVEEFTATLATFSSADSVLPSPIGGKWKVRVVDVVVCAIAEEILATKRVSTKCFVYMLG